MRAGIVLVMAAACVRERGVPCNGVLEPGEICDDGNSADGDGCDCATRPIPLAPQPITSSAPSVVAEDGAWCWFQDERVITDGDRLIVSSISHGGDIQISSYTPTSGERSLAQLDTRLERDDHSVASLLALPDGRFAAFYTRHDGFPHLYTRVTERAGDLSAWQPKLRHSFDYDVTYTNPFLIGDRLMMFIRGRETNPTLIATPDLGATWSDGAQLLDSGERGYDGRVFDHRPYVKYVSDGAGTVHLLYTDGHPAEFLRNSIYHLIYRDNALWRSDGTRVASAKPSDQPLLAPDAGTLVYDGTALPGGQAWTWDAALDVDGQPIAVFSTFPDPKRSFFDHEYRYARWDGTRWQVHVIGHAGTGIYQAEGFYSGGIALDPDDPRIVYFRATSSRSPASRQRAACSRSIAGRPGTAA